MQFDEVFFDVPWQYEGFDGSVPTRRALGHHFETVSGSDHGVLKTLFAPRLPESQAANARRMGLAAALIMRIILLAGIAWIVGLTEPISVVYGFALSWRDLLMLAGGSAM